MALLRTYTSLIQGICKTKLFTPYAPCLHNCNIVPEFKQINKKQNVTVLGTCNDIKIHTYEYKSTLLYGRNQQRDVTELDYPILITEH